MPFIPFRVDFRDEEQNLISSRQQAIEFLEQLFFLSRQEKFHGAGIIFSANNDQALKLRDAYAKNQITAGIKGGNQAEVMQIIEYLLTPDNDDNHLEIEKSIADVVKDDMEGLIQWRKDNRHNLERLLEKFHLIPITTCLSMGGIGKPKNKQVQRDLNYLEEHLKKGWDILGWQNQDTYENDRYAIGGGISQLLTPKQDKYIQLRLTKFAEIYSSPVRDPIALEDTNIHHKIKIDFAKKVTIKTFNWRPTWYSSPNVTLTLDQYINQMRIKDPAKYRAINKAINEENLEDLKAALGIQRSWLGRKLNFKTAGLQILEQSISNAEAEEKAQPSL